MPVIDRNEELRELTTKIDSQRHATQRLWTAFETQKADVAGKTSETWTTDEAAAIEAAHTEYQAAADSLDALEGRRQALWAMTSGDDDRRLGAPRSPGRYDPSQDKKPGGWLAQVLQTYSPTTTADIGSVEATDRLFFDRLTEGSALLSTPGIEVVDIDTTKIVVGKLTGRMAPVAPVAELGTIPKVQAPIDDEEVKPPKWPIITTLSIEAYNDARPIRLAAIETEMVRAIATGFDTACFNGAAPSLQPGLINTVGINHIALTGTMSSLDWVADSIGDLLTASASPSVLYINPFVLKSVLKLKDSTGRPLVGDPAVINAIATKLFGVPTRVTNGVAAGDAFIIDPRAVVVVRRSDVETVIDPNYGFDNGEVGLRAIARMKLVVKHPEGIEHISGLPQPA